MEEEEQHRKKAEEGEGEEEETYQNDFDADTEVVDEENEEEVVKDQPQQAKAIAQQNQPHKQSSGAQGGTQNPNPTKRKQSGTASTTSGKVVPKAVPPKVTPTPTTTTTQKRRNTEGKMRSPDSSPTREKGSSSKKTKPPRGGVSSPEATEILMRHRHRDELEDRERHIKQLQEEIRTLKKVQRVQDRALRDSGSAEQVGKIAKLSEEQRVLAEELKSHHAKRRELEEALRDARAQAARLAEECDRMRSLDSPGSAEVRRLAEHELPELERKRKDLEKKVEVMARIKEQDDARIMKLSKENKRMKDQVVILEEELRESQVRLAAASSAIARKQQLHSPQTVSTGPKSPRRDDKSKKPKKVVPNKPEELPSPISEGEKPESDKSPSPPDQLSVRGEKKKPGSPLAQATPMLNMPHPATLKQEQQPVLAASSPEQTNSNHESPSQTKEKKQKSIGFPAMPKLPSSNPITTTSAAALLAPAERAMDPLALYLTEKHATNSNTTSSTNTTISIPKPPEPRKDPTTTQNKPNQTSAISQPAITTQQKPTTQPLKVSPANWLQTNKKPNTNRSDDILDL